MAPTTKNTKTASKSTTKGKKPAAKGSKTAAKKETGEVKKRSFKMLTEGGESHGRYTGSGPKQAASKAYSKYIQSLSPAEKKRIKGGASATRIYVKESTRGGRRKIFGYEVRRVALDKPHPSVVTDKDGVEKTITYEHRNVVRRYAIPENVLAKLQKASQEGGARKKNSEEKGKKAASKSKSTTKAPAKKASGSKTAAKKAPAKKTAAKKPASKKATRSA